MFSPGCDADPRQKDFAESPMDSTMRPHSWKNRPTYSGYAHAYDIPKIAPATKSIITQIVFICRYYTADGSAISPR